MGVGEHVKDALAGPRPHADEDGVAEVAERVEAGDGGVDPAVDGDVSGAVVRGGAVLVGDAVGLIGGEGRGGRRGHDGGWRGGLGGGKNGGVGRGGAGGLRRGSRLRRVGRQGRGLLGGLLVGGGQGGRRGRGGRGRMGARWWVEGGAGASCAGATAQRDANRLITETREPVRNLDLRGVTICWLKCTRSRSDGGGGPGRDTITP